MSQFSVNPRRSDPYKNFRFRVKWDGRYVTGISKVSSLKRTTEIVELREGGDPSTSRKLPGRTRYDAITLERGITHDREFEAWADAVQNLGGVRDTAASLEDVRKDVIIEVYDEAGELNSSYKVSGCWVSEYQALSDLDASSNAVAIETLTLENEGWERSDAACSSAEPDAAEPA